MFYVITWGGDPEDVLMTTSGVGGMTEVEAMLREAVADPRWADGTRVLIDHTQTDWSGVTTSDLEQHAERLIRGDIPLGRQQFAIVVREGQDYVAQRTLGFRLDRKVPFLVRYFSSLTDARAWLCRPDQLAHVTPRPQPPRAG